jgi:hypothetical protein
MCLASIHTTVILASLVILSGVALIRHLRREMHH